MLAEQRRIFITGTDTDVGKTLFTGAFIEALQSRGLSVIGLKPVAAGCQMIDGVAKNEDAIQLIDSMLVKHPYQLINPISLMQPIAPHISANLDGVELSVNSIQEQCPLLNHREQFVVVEGAGGWLVPLNERETFADYVEQESLEVILVVGLKLGCLNHALLTQQDIIRRGLKIIGWVANHVDPEMLNQQQNIDSLNQRLQCPLIAQIPYLEGDNLTSQAATYVRIPLINPTEM